MRVERIVVEGFGPLANETLELAEGMTVVFGPNESAKTTLHAATYAALCGIRRARGQPRADDRLFASRHRPWNGDPWRVQADLRLEDGRRVELWHDLDGKVDCRAIDAALGRDVSNEIMFDGSPDGSRWLGFDRISFIATACVRQSAIAAVIENADALQDELQRAAATAGRDETAAEAIERLKRFSSENVGLDRANSTKPLRRAIDGLARAEEALLRAQERHAEYLEALERVAERESEREARRRELRVAEAVVAQSAATRAAQIAERTCELVQRYPEEPIGIAGEHELANSVAEALTLWEGSPPEPDLSGPTSAELAAELAKLPERPEGDVSPAAEVLEAESRLVAAQENLDRHHEAEPPASDAVVLPADEHEIEAMILALERDVPEVNEELRQRVETLRERIAGEGRSHSFLPLAVGLVVVLVGVALTAVVSPAAGAVVAVLGLALAAGGLWFRRQRPDRAAAEALATAEEMLGAQEQAAEAVRGARRETEQRAEELGLPLGAVALRELLARAQASGAAAARRHTWQEEHARRGEARDSARKALETALRVHGVATGTDPAADVARYKAECLAREQQEREAARRPRLEQQIAARQAADEAAAARAAARERVLAVATNLGRPATDGAAAVAELRGWQAQRKEESREHDRATSEWSELQQLLDGRSVEAVEAEAMQKRARAEELAASFKAEDLAVVDADEAAARIDEIRSAVGEAEREAASARGKVDEMAASVPSVSEAEERRDAADAELIRVRGLDDVLTRTTRFLEAAQDRVHRNIAPVIQETLRKWLPRVVVSTKGGTVVERYDDALVDPESLAVRVRLGTGPWRDASLLSEGTKEQIFLLLRVALAEHLTKEGEVAPLILDEITAQCDAPRRIALLQLLHELSRERQVILFSHDEGVFEWAQNALGLDSGRDRLEVREAIGVESA